LVVSRIPRPPVTHFANITEPRADVVPPRSALATRPAGNSRVRDDQIAGPLIGDFVADLNYLASELVARDDG
jgi:hypothetical protein